MTQVQLGETNKGFLLVRFKRHRWYQGLLKSNDPIIVSSGLYKYQTIPYFCQKDSSDRLRYLKYTLKYEFCYAVIFGNYVANNTGVTFLKNIQEDGTRFRIGGTGVVIGFSKEYEIKKKLKLIGEPDKVFKKTAVIKNMFNSQMEVQKFIGAKIKTVSGIRGQIKRVVRDKQEGLFRAHFEDKILMSDLVFCRTWVNVPLEKVYNPILNDGQGETELLKTTKELRELKGIQAPQIGVINKEVKRADKIFHPVIIPRKIKEALPFKTKEKAPMTSLQEILQKQSDQQIPAMKSKDEKESLYLISRLKEIQKSNIKEKKEKEKIKGDWKEKWNAGMNRKYEQKNKTIKKFRHKKK